MEVGGRVSQLRAPPEWKLLVKHAKRSNTTYLLDGRIWASSGACVVVGTLVVKGDETERSVAKDHI